MSSRTSRGARAFILDMAVVFAAQVLTRLRGLLTMPLIIRGLGTDAFGTWSQTLAFTILVTAIVGLSLHHSLIRAIAADRSRAGAEKLNAGELTWCELRDLMTGG